MRIEGLPSEVAKFLAEEVRSVIALELLLLLWARRDEDDEHAARTAAELSRELRASTPWTEQELTKLVERRLVERVAPKPDEPAPLQRFRFGASALLPPGAELAVAWLASSYPARRFSIIQALYPSPAEAPGVQAPDAAKPLQSFADAFKLRKDPPNG